MRFLPALAFAAATVAAGAADIPLPPPATSGGMPLLDALAARATARDFDPAPLSAQELSDVFWAAWGFNRPDKRTAPTAMNKQEIDLYAFTADGVFRYAASAETNVLAQVSADDRRADSGFPGFARTAPLVIVYAVDYDKMKMRDGNVEMARRFAAVDCGFVGQNVYLFAAARGWHACYVGRLDEERLSKTLGLPATQVPLFAQAVGRAAPPEDGDADAADATASPAAK